VKVLILAALFITGCGYSARDNELIGQVKKVVHATPLICPDRYIVDVSLGVIRGGVGSMSSQDVWLTVDSDKAIETLKKANESGEIVKLKYDIARLTICKEDHIISAVEITK
jgi:hypothetical protein